MQTIIASQTAGGSINLKATGIVRRIGDLGRVVIPKGIRRILRICEGDPLEIFTDTEDGVIFKKYSAVGEMSAFATQHTGMLSRIVNRPTLVCNCDRVIAMAGVSRNEYMERRVSQDLEETMRTRHMYMRSQNSPSLQPVEGINRAASVVYPIITSSNVVDAVVLLAGDPSEQPDTSDIKFTQATASFLAWQTEN